MPIQPTVLHPENSPDVDLHPETDSGQVTDFLNKTYPVGAVYMSFKSTSPASLFGGTWTAINSGFLISAGYDGITAESVGGNKQVRLLQNNLPGYVVVNLENRTPASVSVQGNSFSYQNVNAGSRVFASIVSASDLGYDDPVYADYINILNPYYAVYMWRRVA